MSRRERLSWLRLPGGLTGDDLVEGLNRRLGRLGQLLTGTIVRKNSTGTDIERTRLNFIEGANVTITVADDAANDEIDVTIASSGGGGVSDGDKGDIVVSGGGATWTIDNDVVTYAKMQNVSATSRFLGRITAGAGDTEELTGTQATTLLDTFTNLLKGLVPASGGGTTNFLRADGTWTSPTASVSATTVEVNLGSAAVWTGKFTITDAAISGTSKVLCWQAPGPYTGKGTRADEAELQPVSVIAVEPGSGSAVVKWQTPPMLSESTIPTIGRNSTLAATTSRNRDYQTTARRIGKVRGNIKFSYTVMA